MFSGFHPEFGDRGQREPDRVEVVEDAEGAEAAQGHFEMAGNEGERAKRKEMSQDTEPQAFLVRTRYSTVGSICTTQGSGLVYIN